MNTYRIPSYLPVEPEESRGMRLAFMLAAPLVIVLWILIGFGIFT